MIDVFNGEFTFLKFLSILAFVTTVGLFFCGIPICRQIWKRKDTSEISGAPFLMGVLGGCCWLTYGYLKGDETVKYVTGAQVFLYGVYTVFYFFMTKKKFWIAIKVVALILTCASLLASVHFFGQKVFHPLGIVCMTLNVGDFAAPLAGLRVVIRRRATSTLPLPLCIANFMVSSEWFLYGLLVKDFYLILPNGIGSFLAFIQLILFFVLPRKPNQRAPAFRLYDWIRRCGSTDLITDIESAAGMICIPLFGKILHLGYLIKSIIVVPVDKTDESGRVSKHRWSTRMITNMAGEIENVIQKVHLGDQFGYSIKLDKDDEEKSAHSVNLANDAETKVSEGDRNGPIVFPMTINDEIQLFKMSKRLMRSKKSINSSEPPVLHLNDDEEDETVKRGHINFAHSAYDNGIRNIAVDTAGQKFVLMRRISESDESGEPRMKRAQSAPHLEKPTRQF